jgi:SAM-dependent methyltransferase
MNRIREHELMDDPNLDARSHLRALSGLERLNFWSFSAPILWTPILRMARSVPHPLRILDIACGGGDVTVRLWHYARRSAISVRIDGCDCSQRAVDYASRKAAECGAAVRFFRLDALTEDFPEQYDILMNSLFMHHLDEHQATALLAKMFAAAQIGILINDLERNPINLLLVTLATRLLSTSPVVHNDGPASVRAAYTVDEMKILAAIAGLSNCTVNRRWPCRLLLTAIRDKHGSS